MKKRSAALRNEIYERYVDSSQDRIVEMQDPATMDASSTATPCDSGARNVLFCGKDHRDRAGRWAGWRLHRLGSPAFCDSALRIFEAVRTRGTFDFQIDVSPGISGIGMLRSRSQRRADAIDRLKNFVETGVIRVDRLVRASASEPPQVREQLRHFLGVGGRAEDAEAVRPGRSESLRLGVAMAASV